MLSRAHASGVGVIVKEALANGRLTARGALPELDAVARSAGTTTDAVALAFVLARPWADVVLSGAATVAELESNLVALELTLDQELLEQLDRIREDPVTYWQERAGLAWN
jgi:aryl-alcohol dehydrogenase-like predicted oxidoreductase